MEAGFIILAVVTAVIGVFVGIRIERSKIHRQSTQGTIYAYYFDDESNPSLMLEYSTSINDIASRKRVLFDVVTIKQNTHK